MVLDEAIEDSFAQVGVLSTLAVAKWMAGDGVDVARDVGQESWCIFGQLAAQRRAPLQRGHQALLALARRGGRMSRAMRPASSQLSPAALAQAIAMLQRSLNVTLVRMCESFEAERKLSDDELAFLATHDGATGLPTAR